MDNAVNPLQHGRRVSSVTERQKLEGLQVARGVAAMLVAAFHTTIQLQKKFDFRFAFDDFRFGHAGVDLFFVVSGFIILHVHRRDIGKRERLGVYVAKRAGRIYPVYWVVLATILPVFFLVPSLGEGYERNLTVIIKSWLLVPQQHFPVLGVVWTLA